jgi:hypothetical protein
MIVSRSTKRRRRAATTLAEAEPDDASSSPWASLHGDLVQLIGWRLLEVGGDMLDYVCLRAVCSHWRSSTTSPHGRGIADPRFHPRRWMMLPEGHGLHPGHGKLRGYVRFVSLSTGAIVRVKLPLFANHCVLDSADGLLLLQRDDDSAVRLLHPFTGDVADLPPLLSLAPDKDDMFEYRAVGCTCVSIGANGVITVMVVIKRRFCLAFATTMDQRWTLDPNGPIISTIIHSPISFQGRLYMLDYDPHLDTMRIIEIVPPRRHKGFSVSSSLALLPPPKLVATVPKNESQRHWNLYLAECDSELLLIGGTDQLKTNIAVYRVADLVTLGKLVPATSIGDNVLLVSDEKTLTVSGRALPNVEGDSVVMVHGGDEDQSFGQYRLGSATWSPVEDGSVLYGVQGPCSLVYYIFTCCCRELW